MYAAWMRGLFSQLAQALDLAEQAGDACSGFLGQLGMTLHDFTYLSAGGANLHDGLCLALGGLDDFLGQGVGLLSFFLGGANDFSGLNGDLLAGAHDFYGVADHLRGLSG